MNQLAHKGMTRGEVARRVGALPFMAWWSSVGLIRYEERDIARCEDMVVGWVVNVRLTVDRVEVLADWSREETILGTWSCLGWMWSAPR